MANTTNKFFLSDSGIPDIQEYSGNPKATKESDSTNLHTFSINHPFA